jgi:hypothetical protein
MVDITPVVVDQVVGEQADGRVGVGGEQGRPAGGVLGIGAHVQVSPPSLSLALIRLTALILLTAQRAGRERTAAR